MKPSCAAALVLLSLPAASYAQSPAPSPTPAPARLEETVEVVAKGLEEPVETVPAMVTVLGDHELEARNAHDLRTALSSVAGVDVAPGGDEGPAASVPEFWGLKEFDAFLLVVDQVPFGGAFNPALGSLSLEDVERVEVLRGPAPVMYGATSFVGVLHVVHRAAADRTREAQVLAGSHDSFGGVAALAGPKWAGFDSRLVADYTKRGFQDERTEYQRFHGAWRNARALGSGHLGLDLDLDVLKQDPASPHPRQGAALSAAVPLDANHNPAGAFLDDTRFTGTARYGRSLGRAAWENTLSFGHWSRDIFRGFLAAVAERPDNAVGIRGKVEGNDIYLDSHLAWQGGERWKAVAGLDHLHGEGEARGGAFPYTVDLAGLRPPTGLERAVPGDSQIEDRREFSGLYAFGELNPNSRVRLEAGLRLNRTMEEREDPREKAREAAQGGGGEEEGEREDTRLTGTLAAELTVWQREQEAVRVFADYRRAFKPAAFDFGIGEAEGEEEEGLLEPESADVYEAGVRSRLAGGRVELEASGFWMDFQNLVVATAVNGVPALQNAGEERFKGVEVEAELKLREALRARAGYSFHDARFRDFVQAFDGVPTQLSGKRLELSARNSGALQVLWAPEHGLQLGADLHRVGSRYLNKRNTALADGYTELSAFAGWRTAKWELRVDARNLGDERPAVSESELGDAQYYRLPSRQVDASLRVRF